VRISEQEWFNRDVRSQNENVVEGIEQSGVKPTKFLLASMLGFCTTERSLNFETSHFSMNWKLEIVASRPVTQVPNYGSRAETRRV